MDKQKVMADYARYYMPLQLMGRIHLSKNPTIDELQVSKAQLQSGYKEIKETNFDGSFTDFLCLVSLRFVIVDSKSEKLDEVVDYILNNWEKIPAESLNLLRLMMRYPMYFFNELRVKPDKNAFTKLSGLWFENYQKKY
jgi:hypothetical protein